MPGPAEQSAPAASDLALAITRTLDAPREAVFAAWTDPKQFTSWMGPGDVRAEYLRASRAAVPSIVADYRASAGIDIEHDQADRAAGRVLAMPVTVIQQDWGAALGYDAAALWRPWAPDLVHHTVDSGHYLAEEAPEQVTEMLRRLLSRLWRAARGRAAALPHGPGR